MIKKFTALLVGAILLCPGCKKKLKSDLSIYENKADSNLKLMTLDEKIGQVSLFTSDWTTTGPSMRNDYIDLIRQGKAGRYFILS